MCVLFAHGIHFNILRVFDINEFLVNVRAIRAWLCELGVQLTGLVSNLCDARQDQVNEGIKLVNLAK